LEPETKNCTIGMPVEVVYEAVKRRDQPTHVPESRRCTPSRRRKRASMKLSISEARTLAVAALKAIDLNDEAASATADHLVDAALRGVTFGSLPRILAIAEKMQEGDSRRPIRVIRETPVSALLDGGDQVGYYVAHRATRMAIEKASKSGIAIVGANNTFYTGLFSYYMEMVTREGLVAMAAGNGPAVVAPEGAIDPRLGTNPIAFGFPSASGDPVIWDIGTCAIMHGEVLLHRRLGEPLPEGVATDSKGAPTRDPAAALAGAIRTWGGHRGSGLAMVVQLLGAMCDAPVISPAMREMAFLIIVIDPKLLMPDGEYPSRVSELSDAIRSARPLDVDKPVRMPFDRSASDRRRRIAENVIEVPDRVFEMLVKLAQSKNNEVEAIKS
jgi:LDH2 family malate/lactate/ureidoglycolate dehydrogenase